MNENPNHPERTPDTTHRLSDAMDHPAEDAVPESPMDVIRRVLDKQEWRHEGDDMHVRFGLALESLEVDVICMAEQGNLASICLKLHIRAPRDRRADVGEFLHRLNYSATRKVWETDYDDGEIRLHVYTDLLHCGLTESLFSSMLEFLCFQADTVFPYLTSVINGQMKVAFAADQAQAALSSRHNKESSEDSPDEG